MTETITFQSREELTHYILDRLIPYCSNYNERIYAAIYAASKANELWVKYSKQNAN